MGRQSLFFTRSLAVAPSITLILLASCGLVQNTPTDDAGNRTDASEQRDATTDVRWTTPADAGSDAALLDADASLPAKITRTSGGSTTTCFEFSNGKVKCCGWGQQGAMGQGSTDDMCTVKATVGTSLPWIDLGLNRKVTAIAHDSTHACAILENGGTKCWGWDLYGALGYPGGPTYRGTKPGELGDVLPEVPLPETAKSIYVANGATCAILASGKLKCWGHNVAGRLGAGPATAVSISDPLVDVGTGRTVLSLAFGSPSTCAILDNHLVKCWGWNGVGQLGQENSKSLGETIGDMGDNLPYVNLGTGRTIKQITGTGWFTCALLDNDTIKCWGSNDAGQLGIGRMEATWGDQPGQMGDNLPEVNLGTGLTPKQIATQGNIACALLTNGQVKCWGGRPLGVAATAPEGPDNRGRKPEDMGDNLPFVELGAGRTAKAISMGACLCVLLDNDRVKCWGSGLYGILGYGDTVDRWGGPAWSGDNMPYVDLGY